MTDNCAELWAKFQAADDAYKAEASALDQARVPLMNAYIEAKQNLAKHDEYRDKQLAELDRKRAEAYQALMVAGCSAEPTEPGGYRPPDGVEGEYVP